MPLWGLEDVRHEPQHSATARLLLAAIAPGRTAIQPKGSGFWFIRRYLHQASLRITSRLAFQSGPSVSYVCSCMHCSGGDGEGNSPKRQLRRDAAVSEQHLSNTNCALHEQSAQASHGAEGEYVLVHPPEYVLYLLSSWFWFWAMNEISAVCNPALQRYGMSIQPGHPCHAVMHASNKQLRKLSGLSQEVRCSVGILARLRLHFSSIVEL